MSKHKNYEMICAKAKNMDLVVFGRTKGSDLKWMAMGFSQLTSGFDNEYFLCLPQHKEVCLNWLNGGEIQNNITKHKRGDSWVDFMPFNFPTCERWSQDCNFMRESSSFRIKPRKEKRWIICSPKHNDVNETLFDYKPDMNSFGKHCQLIEIEVEV